MKEELLEINLKELKTLRRHVRRFRSRKDYVQQVINSVTVCSNIFGATMVWVWAKNTWPREELADLGTVLGKEPNCPDFKREWIAHIERSRPHVTAFKT